MRQTGGFLDKRFRACRRGARVYERREAKQQYCDGGEQDTLEVEEVIIA